MKKESFTRCLFKWWTGQDLPSGKTPDGIFLQAGLAVFAFRGLHTLKQKHRCAFQVLPRIKQFMRFPPQIKSTPKGCSKFGPDRT